MSTDAAVRVEDVKRVVVHIGHRLLCASGCRHPTRVLTSACRRKRGKIRQVDGGLAAATQRGEPTATHRLYLRAV